MAVWVGAVRAHTYRLGLSRVKGTSPFSLKLNDLECVPSRTAHCEVASFTVAHIQATVEDPGISTSGFGMARVKFFKLRRFICIPRLFKDCKMKKKTQKKHPYTTPTKQPKTKPVSAYRCYCWFLYCNWDM